jgi:SAM-dependent methyltransferase
LANPFRIDPRHRAPCASQAIPPVLALVERRTLPLAVFGFFRRFRHGRSGGSEGIASGGRTAVYCRPVREPTPPDRRLADLNRAFYESMWSTTRFVPPHRFNTWPLLSALAHDACARLEVGPGNHPRLPLDGTTFVDVSPAAIAALRKRGAHACCGDLTALPFPDASFDLVSAFDVVEHVAGGDDAFGELARVARDDAVVACSVPLHAARWTAFDDLVGHVRRYEPDELRERLDDAGIDVEQSASFGMAPRNGWLLRFAVWGLTRHRARATRWYNGVILPIGLLRQRRLVWSPGLIDLHRVDEVMLVCRRRPRADVRRAQPRFTPIRGAQASSASSS